jgi:non-reducing end alpha-L-arabinofuranosidase
VQQASGMCLDDPDFATGNGTQMQIYACNGGSNQAWWLPTV